MDHPFKISRLTPSCLAVYFGALLWAMKREDQRHTLNRRFAILAGLIILACLAPLVATVILKRPATENAEVHYRVFEVSAGYIDTGPASLATKVTDQNDTGKAGSVKASIAELPAAQRQAFFSGRDRNVGDDGKLLDRRLSVQGWKGTRDCVAYNGRMIAGKRVGNIVGVAGVRRKNGTLQLYLDYEITHQFPDIFSLTSKLHFEGNAPPPGDTLLFTIPFTDSIYFPKRKCLVVALDVNTDTSADGIPQMAHPVVSSPPTLSFGPVIEKVVESAVNLYASTTGTVSAVGLEATNKDQAVDNIMDLERAGWDLVRNHPDTLLGVGLKILPIPQGEWNAAKPEQVAQRIKDAPVQALVGFRPGMIRDQIDTCIFQTRTGTMGILQFTGFTENRSGVWIRYRLVNVAPAPAPAISMTEGNSGQATRLDSLIHLIRGFNIGFSPFLPRRSC